MKLLFTTLLILTLSPLSYGQISTNCLPEKGIKIAKTVAIHESELNNINVNTNNHREVHYDKKGRVILIKNGLDKSLFRREYKEDKLQWMISIRKKLPDFYSEEDLDLLMEHASEIRDTATIVRCHKNGEPAELKHADEAIQIFEYKDCSEESNTFISSDGDTIQQYRSIFENGVLIKTIWTPFKQVKSDVITNYYDYEFNKNGHWIRRKYKGNNGDAIIEKRDLTYY